jgi:hypothetical protein
MARVHRRLCVAHLQDEEAEERREVDGAQQRRHQPAEQLQVWVGDLRGRRSAANGALGLG